MIRQLTFVDADPLVDPDFDLERYSANNLDDRRRDLEDFDLEIREDYQRAFRSVYRRIAAIAASVFLLGFLASLVYFALREADAQKGLISSEEYLRRVVVNYFRGGLLVFIFFQSAVRSYKIVREYNVLIDELVVLLGSEA